MDNEERCNLIRSTIQAIPLDGSISVLTGSNGSGKSLVRSQLNFRTRESGKNVVHASMAFRTGTHSHMGALGSLVRDSDWMSTSYETFKNIKTAIRSTHDNFLCLDEIEIGCSAETVMGMTHWLNANLKIGIEGSLGCLVITHSPHVVENLNFDHWFNLDGYASAEEWLHREIVPVDMDSYVEQQMELFKMIRDRMKKD